MEVPGRHTNGPLNSSRSPGPDERIPHPDLTPNSLDEFADILSQIRADAGFPAFKEIRRRVGTLRERRHPGMPDQTPGLVTVYDLFKHGRRRLDIELLSDVLAVLGRPDLITPWRSRYGYVLRDLQNAQVGAQMIVLSRTGSHRLFGRDTEIARQLARLSHRSDGGGCVVVAGLPGVGKTAFARTLLRQATHDLPGVIIEARIQGEQRVVVPPRGLVSELHATASPVGGAAGCLLDDVPSAQYLRDVCAMLGDSMLVVATSRHRLEAGDCDIVELRPLAQEDCERLIHDRLAGVGLDPTEVAQLARITQGVPLAANLVASQMGQGSRWSPTDHLRRLERENVDLVPGLASTYEGLSGDARHLLHLAALHPAPLNSSEMTAFLGTEEVDPLVAELERAYLIERREDARFTMHDVVRTFALRHTWAEEPDSEIRGRLTDLANHLSAGAREALHSDSATAIDAWLSRHLGVIAATSQLAGDFGIPAISSVFSELLAGYLDEARRWCDALAIHQAAATSGLPADRGRANLRLANVMRWLGMWDQAREVLNRLIATEPALVAPAIALLIEVNAISGATTEALRLGEQALATARAQDQPQAERAALNALSTLYQLVGRVDDARRVSRECLALSLRLDDRVSAALALNNLGLHELLAGDGQKALDYASEALSMLPDDTHHSVKAWIGFTIGHGMSLLHDPASVGVFEDAYERLRTGGRPGPLEAEVLAGLANVRFLVGRVDQAEADLVNAHQMALDMGSPRLVARALNSLGEVRLAQGLPAAARDYFVQAATLATHCNSPLEMSRAQVGLGDVCAAQGNIAAATQQWQQTHSIANAPPVITAEAAKRVADHARRDSAN